MAVENSSDLVAVDYDAPKPVPIWAFVVHVLIISIGITILIAY